MELTVVNKNERASKPEWKIILENLVYQDQMILYRICRRMIIQLNRIDVKEIKDIMNKFGPGIEATQLQQTSGANWPKPKGSPFLADQIIDKVFFIADKYLPDEDISKLLRMWLHQEQINDLSLVLERRHAPLSEVLEAVKKYLRLFSAEQLQSVDEIIGLRVGLIYRFLSENLTYINVAKNYLTIKKFDGLLDRVIGPANGNGKLGGKSSGLILARQIIRDKRIENSLFEKVRTPKSRYLTSDALFEFLHYNALEEFVFLKYQNIEDIRQEYSFLEYVFKNSHFPPEAIQTLNMIVDDFEGKPIIVRSSSLLEDSFEAAFSGKYKSLFISNTGSKEERLASLMNAIAEVYASSFGPDPIEYRRERGLLDFREEMGILIQQVVGNQIGKYYLPSYAGVAFSNNEMRWSTRIKREDGIIRLVAGLGTRAVDRTIDDYPILIAPGQPGLRVNQTVEDNVKYSQHYVDVINLEKNSFETIHFTELVEECKGNLPSIEKIVSFNKGNTLVEPISSMDDFVKEDMIITFNNLISRTDFIKTINSILKELQDAYMGPVDVEFASDGNDFYLLQCRPQSKTMSGEKVKIPSNIPYYTKIFSASKFVNNGTVKDIEYVVYVDCSQYKLLTTAEQMKTTGTIIGKLNSILPKRKFILIGPGRWGSKGDIKLGVPVIYSDINNTAMLIEVARIEGGYLPEVSFGTHFFQDLVEANIKYLPLYPDEEGNILNENFFRGIRNSLPKLLPDFAEFQNVIKVLKVDDYKKSGKLHVYMDGDLNQALAFVQ
ncbi:MAG: PEP/pyruvate-binding domain-containing protein [bacterium]